jgi:SAM-dependent methyltransferase
MTSIDWFGALPKQNRAEIIRQRAEISENDRASMLTYGEEYFDGHTPWGYGGYRYDGRFSEVVDRLIAHYKLTSNSHILDIGCAKGFLLFEFYKKGFKNVWGVDISDYAISQVPEELREKCFVGSADDLSRWKDRTIDFVISKDVIHNLPPAGSEKALREIARVSNGSGFLQINSYRDDREKKCLKAWVITIKTVKSTSEWIELFEKVGYRGDYNFLCHNYELPSGNKMHEV